MIFHKIALIITISALFGFLLGIFIQAHYPNEIFLIQDYTIDEYLRKKNTVSSLHTQNSEQLITLKTRRFKISENDNIFDTERDSTYNYENRKLHLKETALILIDVWSSHPNDGWMERTREHMKLKMKPLLLLARKYNMTIVHSPHGREIAEEFKPLPNELVINSRNFINDSTELDKYLKAHNISTLFYAGYASNICILNRPTGIIRMSEQYNIILIRDCTLAVETPESLDGQWANEIAINIVELNWGETTTLKDLQTALELAYDSR